jgi:hypothetical protein
MAATSAARYSSCQPGWLSWSTRASPRAPPLPPSRLLPR